MGNELSCGGCGSTSVAADDGRLGYCVVAPAGGGAVWMQDLPDEVKERMQRIQRQYDTEKQVIEAEYAHNIEKAKNQFQQQVYEKYMGLDLSDMQKQMLEHQYSTQKQMIKMECDLKIKMAENEKEEDSQEMEHMHTTQIKTSEFEKAAYLDLKMITQQEKDACDALNGQAALQQKTLDQQFTMQLEMIKADCTQNINMAESQFKQQCAQALLELNKTESGPSWTEQKHMIEAECAHKIQMAKIQFEHQRDQMILAQEQLHRQIESQLAMAKQQRMMAISQQASQFKLKLEMQKKADKGATKGTAGAGAGTKTGTAGKSTAGAGKTAGPTKMVTTKGRPKKA